MLELFIVRHGESIRNRACLLAHQGQDAALLKQLGDPSDEAEWPLTQQGVIQANLAGNWLADQAGQIDAAYTSPYLRAIQTARNLHLPVDAKIDSRLKEREWGNYLQSTYSVSDYLSDLAVCGDIHWKSGFPGSESIQDLIPSTASFLEELHENHPSGRIVIVTHGGRMQAIEHIVEQRDPTRKFTNCCVLQYRIDTDTTSVRVEYPASPELAPLPWETVSASGKWQVKGLAGRSR